MNMLIIGLGAIITGLIIGTRVPGAMGCDAAFGESSKSRAFLSDWDLTCRAITAENFNWAIALIVLGVALLAAALIQGLRSLYATS